MVPLVALLLVRWRVAEPLSMLTLALAEALLARFNTGLTGLYIQRCVSAYSSTARVSMARGGGRDETLAGSHREMLHRLSEVNMFKGTLLDLFVL